jgi:hypothetical protein
VNPKESSASVSRSSVVQGCTAAVRWLMGLLSLLLAVLGVGCTSLEQFVHNGFKVGPNYQRPPPPLAQNWIDARHPRVKSFPTNYSAWWAVFGDPILNGLVKIAYEQNVNLRVAGSSRKSRRPPDRTLISA